MRTHGAAEAAPNHAPQSRRCPPTTGWALRDAVRPCQRPLGRAVHATPQLFSRALGWWPAFAESSRCQTQVRRASGGYGVAPKTDNGSHEGRNGCVHVHRTCGVPSRTGPRPRANQGKGSGVPPTG
eukprot:scaffold320_cov362-Prasinococcus_capsulatus_cf.AAC.8